MIDTVEATLVMELNVECPYCEHTFDLFKSSKNEEGQLFAQVLSDDRWKIDAADRLETNTHCPECSAPFDVKGIAW